MFEAADAALPGNSSWEDGLLYGRKQSLWSARLPSCLIPCILVSLGQSSAFTQTSSGMQAEGLLVLSSSALSTELLCSPCPLPYPTLYFTFTAKHYFGTPCPLKKKFFLKWRFWHLCWLSSFYVAAVRCPLDSLVQMAGWECALLSLKWSWWVFLNRMPKI